jgi:hypothetical protein
MSLCCECCVLCLCDGLVTRPEGFYRLWCVEKQCEASQNKQVEPLGDTWSYHSLSKN